MRQILSKVPLGGEKGFLSACTVAIYDTNAVASRRCQKRKIHNMSTCLYIFYVNVIAVASVVEENLAEPILDHVDDCAAVVASVFVLGDGLVPNFQFCHLSLFRLNTKSQVGDLLSLTCLQ